MRFSRHENTHVFFAGVAVDLSVKSIRCSHTQPNQVQEVVDTPANRAISEVFGLIAGGLEFRIVGEPTALTNDAITEADGRYFQCVSSGTSGRPKSIRRCHESWIKSFEVNAGLFDLKQTDVYAVFGRLAHSLSLYGLLEAAHIGADVHILANMRPDHQLQDLRKQRVTILYATPAQLRMICAVTKTAGVDQLPDVRHILCGGGVMDSDCRRDIQALCPDARITEFYGASETSFITMSNRDTPAGTVGRPYPGVTLEIRNERGVATADIGEIWVKSPYLFQGYGLEYAAGSGWDNGFFSVGDVGRTDADGNLHLMGRNDRMVTIADQNVFPEEIEIFLQNRPEVDNCVVIPRENTKRGHVLIAIVGGSPDPVLRENLLSLCRQSLGPLKAPRDIVFLEEFPLLAAGKPDIQAITARLQVSP